MTDWASDGSIEDDNEQKRPPASIKSGTERFFVPEAAVPAMQDFEHAHFLTNHANEASHAGDVHFDTFVDYTFAPPEEHALPFQYEAMEASSQNVQDNHGIKPFVFSESLPPPGHSLTDHTWDVNDVFA